MTGPDVADAVRVVPPFVDVQVAAKLVIALPLFAPGVNDTRNEPTAVSTAVTAVGATGEPAITAPDSDDWAPVPAAFTAATRNVYEVPFVNPSNV